jgi:hypothetical protein
MRFALNQVIQMGGTRLNSEIVKALVSIVPIYSVGTRIRITFLAEQFYRLP